MDWQNYIKPELLIFIPVLVAVGAAIKNLTKINNKWIPILLGGLGIVLVTIYQLAFGTIEGGNGWALALTSIVQGVIVAAAAVYSNQIVKQLGKEE